jgi:hypothetical protein
VPEQESGAKQKGRALRTPCLICPNLVALGYPGDIPTPPRAMTKLFEPTLYRVRSQPLEKTGSG